MPAAAQGSCPALSQSPCGRDVRQLRFGRVECKNWQHRPAVAEQGVARQNRRCANGSFSESLATTWLHVGPRNGCRWVQGGTPDSFASLRVRLALPALLDVLVARHRTEALGLPSIEILFRHTEDGSA